MTQPRHANHDGYPTQRMPEQRRVQQNNRAGYVPSYVNNSPNLRIVGYEEVSDSQGFEPPKNARKATRKQKKQERIDTRSMQQEGMVPLGAYDDGRRKHGFVRGFFSFLLAIILICAIPIGAYCFMLDRALALDPDERAQVEEVLQPAVPGKPYYCLLLGCDSRNEDDQLSGRSDVILLLRIDPIADQVTMVTIPRDTPYRDADGNLMKINETYAQGGAAYSIQAVSELTGVPISHFVELGFSDLESIVDVLGGVTVDVDTELGYNDAYTGDYVTIEPGTQELTGQQAQIFARARHEYESQDAGRQSNVRSLVNACVDSLLDKPFYEIPGTVLDVARYIGTDMKSFGIATTAIPMALHPGSTTIYACAGTYDGDTNPETGTWMCYEDPEGWASLMATVDAGEDPSE